MESTLADRLRRARTAKGLTQTVVADLVGLSQSGYADIESGKSATTTKIGSLSAALGVSALWLETGQGEQRNSVGEQEVTYDLLGVDPRLMALLRGMPPRKQAALLELLGA